VLVELGLRPPHRCAADPDPPEPTRDETRKSMPPIYLLGQRDGDDNIGRFSASFAMFFVENRDRELHGSMKQTRLVWFKQDVERKRKCLMVVLGVEVVGVTH